MGTDVTRTHANYLLVFTWHSKEVYFALLTQQPRVRFSAFPIILDVAKLIDGTYSLESLKMLIEPSSTSSWQSGTTKKLFTRSSSNLSKSPDQQQFSPEMRDFEAEAVLVEIQFSCNSVTTLCPK